MKLYLLRGRGCHYDCMVVGFITTYAISACHHKVVNFHPTHSEVYSIQHHVIKFVSDLHKLVGGFLLVLWFPPPIKLTVTEILLKVALNIITLIPTVWMWLDSYLCGFISIIGFFCYVQCKVLCIYIYPFLTCNHQFIISRSITGT